MIATSIPTKTCFVEVSDRNIRFFFILTLLKIVEHSQNIINDLNVKDDLKFRNIIKRQSNFFDCKFLSPILGRKEVFGIYEITKKYLALKTKLIAYGHKGQFQFLTKNKSSKVIHKQNIPEYKFIHYKSPLS